jgi:hypothetical protein
VSIVIIIIIIVVIIIITIIITISIIIIITIIRIRIRIRTNILTSCARNLASQPHIEGGFGHRPGAADQPLPSSGSIASSSRAVKLPLFTMAFSHLEAFLPGLMIPVYGLLMIPVWYWL